MNSRAVLSGHVAHHQPAAANAATTLSDSMEHWSHRGIFMGSMVRPTQLHQLWMAGELGAQRLPHNVVLHGFLVRMYRGLP
jgi:hypothetical protein